jgi:hypothetical protein
MAFVGMDPLSFIPIEIGETEISAHKQDCGENQPREHVQYELAALTFGFSVSRVFLIQP